MELVSDNWLENILKGIPPCARTSWSILAQLVSRGGFSDVDDEMESGWAQYNYWNKPLTALKLMFSVFRMGKNEGNKNYLSNSIDAILVHV